MHSTCWHQSISEVMGDNNTPQAEFLGCCAVSQKAHHSQGWSGQQSHSTIGQVVKTCDSVTFWSILFVMCSSTHKHKLLCHETFRGGKQRICQGSVAGGSCKKISCKTTSVDNPPHTATPAKTEILVMHDAFLERLLKHRDTAAAWVLNSGAAAGLEGSN